MTLIRELIDIPTQVADGDFVLKLTEGVTSAKAQATVDSYEVTPQLAGAFDEALGLVAGAVEGSSSRASFLLGTFGSGKSHFMAMLHLLLTGNPAARAKAELHAAIAKHDPALAGKRFLLVPVHFLDAASIEQKVLGGYVERMAAAHPDAPVPPVFLGDNIVTTELPGLRSRLGEDKFLEGLNAGADADEWGEFASTWTTETVDAALAQPATHRQRQELVSGYIGAYRQATAAEALATGEGYIDLSRGLSAISAHAKELGYDAVILFLDELVLWLASKIGNLDFVQGEAQKLTNLVEGSNPNRPAPIISLVAKQRQLSDLVGDHVAGDERRSFDEMLAFQTGRFGTIVLEARNLPVIAKRRLLQPVDPAADELLSGAVDRTLAEREDVREVLLGSEADLALFRTVYPFSPSLVRTLVDVSELLQRERTGLKVMLQLLVDKRDTLELGQIIPVGDIWDVIAAKDEPVSPDMANHFKTAKRLYRTKLRPALLRSLQLTDETAADDPRWQQFTTDDRLLKTILLASLVPDSEAFRNLDARRLAALNWGTVRSPIARRETQVVVEKLHRWQTELGELRVGDDPVNPMVSLAIVDVDSESVIQAVRPVFDNPGARRRALRYMIDQQLGERLGTDLSGTVKVLWRGTERAIDTAFGNIRDPNEVADAALRASGDRPKLFLDFPFDEHGFTPEEDLVRLDDWASRNQPTTTVCWLPSFLNHEGLTQLGRFVAVDELLKGDRLDLQTQHLSAVERQELRPVLTNVRDQLRAQLRDAVLVAYGVRSAGHSWIDGASALTDHFRSLDEALVVRPTTAPDMDGAFEDLCDQLLAQKYPGHPQFEQKVTAGMLKTAWEEIQRALADRDGRVVVETGRRSAVRTVIPPLNLGAIGDSTLALTREWATRLDRRLAAAKEEGHSLTVGDLREAIDTYDDGKRGLPPEISDLIVLTVAAQCDHSLSHGGMPAVVTPGRALDASIVLRPEQLPSSDHWRIASGVVAKLFGISVGANVSGPEVGALGDRLAEKVRELRTPVTELVGPLDQAMQRIEAPAGDRSRTAVAARDLVQLLGGAAGHRAVEILVGFQPPTSLDAVARSISQATAVMQALANTNWDLIWRSGDDLRERLVAALQADELVTGFDAARRDLEIEATRRIPTQHTSGDGGEPKRSTSTTPAPESVLRKVRAASDLDGLRSELDAAVAEHGAIEVTWRPLAEG